VYGAEISDCDTPFSLVNETFRWIEENLKDSVDFVIWTGDSARHDNDEKYPRTDKQVAQLNRDMVDRFVDVFGKPGNINDTDPTNEFIVPIVPTFGNNDILPHNIFAPGPNKWTKMYLDIWAKFIPEAQRHTFAYGGWFFTEVIPNQLAVVSLNTIYFFDSNGAVDGCARKSEPGYQQMEWLRIQLQFLRKRGMKAIMMGHVPPARTEGKQSWDETCWQKYTLWMKQYRDVVVGGTFGHMNIDHFMFQDEKDLTFKEDLAQQGIAEFVEDDEDHNRDPLGDRLTIQSSGSYLTELRESWSKIPSPPSGLSMLDLTEEEKKKKKKKKDKKKDKQEKFLRIIGGPFAERYSVSLVSPSVIPNYFPSLRVVEYNITGIENTPFLPSSESSDHISDPELDNELEALLQSWEPAFMPHDELEVTKKKKKKPKKPPFHMPKPPSSTSPPGPAYSPQPFTWTAIVQYYANLTYINNDFNKNDYEEEADEMESLRWHNGPHHGKKTPNKPHPKKLVYEIEYDTRNDTVMGNMPDLTVRSWLHRAERIGKFKPLKGDRMDMFTEEDQEVEELEPKLEDFEENEEGDEDLSIDKQKKKGEKHKKKKRKIKNKAWFTFVKRAYVGSITEEQLHEDFGQAVEPT
jgi:endopolyphosphatase